MRVRAVDFVGIAVSDMDEARGFYRDALGLSVIEDSEGWAEFDAGNVTLSLIKMPASELAGSGWRNGVVALAVEDLAAALEELRGKGVRIVEETQEFTPCFMATVEDPFGNRLMLHQRKDGTAG